MVENNMPAVSRPETLCSFIFVKNPIMFAKRKMRPVVYLFGPINNFFISIYYLHINYLPTAFDDVFDKVLASGVNTIAATPVATRKTRAAEWKEPISALLSICSSVGRPRSYPILKCLLTKSIMNSVCKKLFKMKIPKMNGMSRASMVVQYFIL